MFSRWHARCFAGPETGLGLENMRHVISIHDVVSDTMHQFAPTYHNYVLYSNGGSKDAPKTVRSPLLDGVRFAGDAARGE